MAGPGNTHRPDDSHADREFARFERVAKPMADGSGWFEPTREPVPAGIPIEDWRAFVRDCAHLGKVVRPWPNREKYDSRSGRRGQG